jgi:hypothetical protein
MGGTRREFVGEVWRQIGRCVGEMVDSPTQGAESEEKGSDGLMNRKWELEAYNL